MILRSIWIASGLLLAALILSITALMYGVNLRFFSGVLEQKLSETLDREVTIEAPRLRIRDSIDLSLGRVTIGGQMLRESAGVNNDDPYLLELDMASVRLRTATLFKRPILIEDLQVHGLDVHLVRDEDGNLNLPTTSDDEQGSSEEEELELPFVLAQVSFSDTRIERVHKQTGKTVVFEVEALSQQAIADQRIELRGSGTLQNRPWTLSADGSRLSTLLDGQDIHGEFQGSLGEIKLSGSFALPKVSEPKDLRLDAQLRGPVPPRIAELSPLLEPGDEMNVVLDISDIDPGIHLDLQASLSHLSLSLSGDIDRPGRGDGLALSMKLDTTNLPALANALGMGATENLPLSASAKISRNGRSVSLHDLNVTADEHSIRGTVSIPSIPSTDGTELRLHAVGPDFGLYQRLLERPLSINAPYEVRANIQANTDGAELIDTVFKIGESVLRAQGSVGQFPSYRGSELQVHLTGPSAKTIGALFSTPLPEAPYDVSGSITVSDDALVEIHSLTLKAFDTSTVLDGSLMSYPDLNNINLRMSLDSQSLSKTAQYFGVENVTSAPATLAVRTSGDIENLKVDNVQLNAAGLELKRDSGSLRLSDGILTTDMQLSANIEDLRVLLANYAPEVYSSDSIPTAPLSFVVKPELTEQLYRLRIQQLQTLGISGDAEIQISRDLSIDDQTRLVTDLLLTDLSLIPEKPASYKLPDGGLRLTADTFDRGGKRRIEAAVSHRDEPLLTVTLEQGKSAKNSQITITGEGTDVRRFGALPKLSDVENADLPYRIDATIELNDRAIGIQAKEITLASTTINGRADYDLEKQALNADVNIPNADLRPWLSSETPSKQAASQDNAAASDNDGRLIPKTPIPTAWMNKYTTQIQLTTGTIFVPDPLIADRSVIESSALSLKSGAGRAALLIDNLSGSRGTLAGSINMEAVAEVSNVSVDLSLIDVPLGIIAVGSTLETLPKHQIETQLTATGSTIRELAGALDGEFLLLGGSGSLKDMSLSFATQSFVTQLFSTLLPTLKSGSPDMQVQCSVLAARASNGVLALDPGFVFRTKRVDLSARGEIDLKQERLSVRFDNQARKGLGISAASFVNPYVQITGSLAKPSLGIDVTSSAIAGGAAVATGGLTVLAKPLYGRFLRRSNPCDVALERWEKQSAD